MIGVCVGSIVGMVFTLLLVGECCGNLGFALCILCVIADFLDNCVLFDCLCVLGLLLIFIVPTVLIVCDLFTWLFCDLGCCDNDAVLCGLFYSCVLFIGML